MIILKRNCLIPALSQSMIFHIFVTDVYSLSNDVTVYTRKYYTVVRGYIYTYAIQSKTDKVSDDMNNNLVSIINSAKYQKVKNSPLSECRIYRNSL